MTTTPADHVTAPSGDRPADRAPITRIRVSEDAAGRPEVEVTGELDLAAAPGLLAATRDVLRHRPVPGTLRLNLSGVGFVDVAGIRAVLRCRRIAAEAGSELLLVRPSAKVQRLLRLIRGIQASAPVMPASHGYRRTASVTCVVSR